ncbi:hypothetical protein BJ508DRAFT_329053 [Ascobolus immersus RN42]|uniref:Uncharacterized protein n=1 Tax=Ascobolus immersus RN42 TaxID=1160509 RepID=A0A3N4HXJ3_ASCIM|nr:hypothetical protein BJ508DRAFT_329053 [Ascobolus immersus RN42]
MRNGGADVRAQTLSTWWFGALACSGKAGTPNDSLGKFSISLAARLRLQRAGSSHDASFYTTDVETTLFRTSPASKNPPNPTEGAPRVPPIAPSKITSSSCIIQSGSDTIRVELGEQLQLNCRAYKVSLGIDSPGFCCLKAFKEHEKDSFNTEVHGYLALEAYLLLASNLKSSLKRRRRS